MLLNLNFMNPKGRVRLSRNYITQQILSGDTFTRPSGELWQDSDNNLRTAELNEPVFDGRRYVSPTESSPYDLSGNLIAGLKGISTHPAIVNKCQTYGFIPDDEVQGEVVINGGFDTDTDWLKQDTWAIGGGVGYTTAPITTDGRWLYQNYMFPRGVVFRISVDIVVNAGSCFFTIGGNYQPTITESGTYEVDIVSDAVTNTFIGVSAYAGFDGSVDNISAKEVKYAVGTKSFHDGTSFIQNIDGMTLSGDVAGVFSIEQDTVALDAAGYGGPERNGKKLAFDNAGGVGNSFIDIVGAMSAVLTTSDLICNVTGGTLFLRDSSGANPVTTTSATYIRLSNEGFLATLNRSLQILIGPGATANFLLPGLYERSTAPQYPVPANSLTTSTTQSGAVLELPFPTGSRRAVINYVHYALELGVTRWVAGNYTDANNYVGVGINGTLAFIEKMTGGVSEITSLPLAPVTDTEYEVIAGFNPDNMMFITVDGVAHTVDGSTTLAPVLASTFELGSMDGSGQVDGQFKSIKLQR